MTKTTALITAARHLGLGTGFALGLAALIASGPALANSAGDWVGVAAAIKGKVQLTSLRAEPHKPTSGERLFMGDRITSGTNSHLQILLRDKTTFTLGEDCDLTIDKFVYDPATGAGEIHASVTEGAFRFVTGEIPHRDPDALKINIPSGTIGVRGTIGEAVVGEAAIEIARGSGIDVTGADPKLAVLVVLRGPGNNLNTGDRVGQVVVSSGGESVTLSRPNWASFIAAPAAPPSDAFKIPGSMMAELNAILGPQKGNDKAEEEEDTAQDNEGSGQGGSDEEGTDVAEGGVDGEESGSAADVGGSSGGGDSGSVSADAGQDTAAGDDLSDIQYGAEEEQLAGSVGTEPDATDTPFADGPTRPSDFLTRQGSANYASSGHAMTGGGSYNYNSTVNFDTRAWNSTATWSGTAAFDASLSASGTVDLSGNTIARSTSQNYGVGTDATLNEQILNKNGVVAGAIQHSLSVTHTGVPITVTGSGVAQ